MLAYALVCSVLIHAALVLSLGRMASARENKVHTEIVEFELRGNTNEISVRSLKASRPSKTPAPPRMKPSTPSEDLQTLQKPENSLEGTNEEALHSAQSESDSDASGGVFGQENGLEVSVQERYRRELQAMLEKRKDYPLLAKRLRQQGKVLVRFTLQRDGSVVAADVIENSQFDSLNQAARKLISEINGLKPFPAEIKKAQWVFVLPVEYRM